MEPRVKLYMPREASFHISLKYIDETMSTRTSLDAMLEKGIDDNWNVDRDRDLSDTWTVFYYIHDIGRKATGWIYMVRGATDKEANDIKTRLPVARDMERDVRCEKKSKSRLWKIRSLTTQEGCAVSTESARNCGAFKFET